MPPAGWRPPWPYTPPGPEERRLIEEIERVFVDLPLDGGTTWHQGEAIDNHEPDELVEAVGRIDRVERWTDVRDGSIATFPSAAGYLDDAGFRFYLPTAMRFELRYRDRDGAVIDDMFAGICEGPRPRLRVPDGMTPAQRAAYERFADWYRSFYTRYP